MYAALFRLLPGPKWFKAVLALIVFAGLVYVLFRWGFPWINEVLELQENTVN